MRSVTRLSVFASALALSVSLSSTAQAQGQPVVADDPEVDAEDVNADPESGTETVIVVTGSSLRGVAPVGSNLVSVGQEQIQETSAQTVQQILKTVPAVVGSQSAGQGSFGSFDAAGTNAPTIHGLGASASNSTLILLNGHRLPVSGVNHVLADPNIIAPLAIQRVEVLADGASSVYGSDAVAGVINFITRRNYDGIEATVQRGFGDEYHTFNAGVLGGTTWDSGNLLVSYNFSDRSNLAAVDRREFAKADQRDRGGRNFLGNRCSPASITLGAGTGVPAGTYYTPYSSTSTAPAGDCDASLYWDLIPAEERHNVLVSAQQDVGESLHLTADFIYAHRVNVQNLTRGSASGTIYGPGSTPPPGRSINPFFQTVTGSTATSQTVNFNADQLLGPGATATGSAETFYGRFDAEYDVTETWALNAGLIIGRDRAKVISQGVLNGATFALALNGFTSATLNGVVTNSSQALTAANAIDVFSNRTSAATLAALADSTNIQVGDQTIKNVYGKINGELFDLPGGAVQIAVGAEYIDYTLKQNIVRPNGLGAASTNSAQLNIDYERDVKSAYAELFLPLIGPDQDIPLVRRFELNLSGRIDDYSDFGTTKNPKIAANWEIIEGLLLRGNYAESFVAPALTSRGANAFGLTGESGFSGVTGAGLPGGAPTISLANFPTANQIPGAVCTATTCTINNVNGILLAGGNGNLRPQTGKAYSIGADFTPTFLPGFRLSVTYWVNELRGGITAPVPSLALGAADLSYLLQLYPAGATPAQIAAASAGLPQTGTITQPVYFTYNFQQNNVLNLNVAGLDVSASYQFDTAIGSFTLGGAFTRKLKFDQFFGASGQVFSVLGTAGFNTTFPSVKFEGRANVGFESGPFAIDFFYNYLGGYLNWSGGAAIPVTRTNGVPSGGGDPVDSFQTIDAHVAFTLEDLGFLDEAQLFVDVTNLFDEEPPQYNVFAPNGAAGYDATNASPLGRIVTVGVRTKL